MPASPSYLVLTAVILLLAACAQQKPGIQPTANRTGVDFSGTWALDYGQSDNIQTRLNGMVRELQRQAERRAQSGDIRRPGANLTIGNGTDSGSSIIGLARMSDLVTRSQLLDIDQDPERIRVRREDNFALACDFHDGTPVLVETPLGREQCGWEGHQLAFVIALPEGLSIRHRMTLGPDGEWLNIATTVVSDRVSSPFTLNRVYRRMESGAAGYSCRQTLTRGKVCTTETP